MNQQIRKCRQLRKRARGAQDGQALIEYVLTILLVLGLFRIMDQQIKIGIGNMWKFMAQNIAAGCPVPQDGEGCSDSLPEALR